MVGEAKTKQNHKLHVQTQSQYRDPSASAADRTVFIFSINAHREDSVGSLQLKIRGWIHYWSEELLNLPKRLSSARCDKYFWRFL